VKPYPFAFHVYIDELRPVIGISEPKIIKEVSNRIPPTSHQKPLPRSKVKAQSPCSKSGGSGCGGPALP
jgi:hypothetical protein